MARNENGIHEVRASIARLGRPKFCPTTVELICALAGGPRYYTGRGMRDSHVGLNITRSEWEANLELTQQALRKNRVASREEAEFVSLFERYRNDIVEAK